jgi:hypothetical protein
MSEPGPSAPAAPAAKPQPAPRPAPPAAPPRPLPDEAAIAAWVAGEEVPLVGALFEQLDLAKFDILTAQVRKEELLPQHWQPITLRGAPPPEEFERLPEVGRLRVRYKDQELARRRLAALRVAWEELRGKRPALFEAADLFAAFRRILQHKREVVPYDLLTAVRDVWRDLDLPRGGEQIAIFWNCLVQVRKVTKK